MDSATRWYMALRSNCSTCGSSGPMQVLGQLPVKLVQTVLARQVRDLAQLQGDRCILTIDCQAGELTSTHEAGVLWAQASGLGHLRPQLANVRVPVAVHGLAQDALHLHRQQPALAAVLMGQTPQPRLALQCMQQA